MRDRHLNRYLYFSQLSIDRFQDLKLLEMTKRRKGVKRRSGAHRSSITLSCFITAWIYLTNSRLYICNARSFLPRQMWLRPTAQAQFGFTAILVCYWYKTQGMHVCIRPVFRNRKQIHHYSILSPDRLITNFDNFPCLYLRLRKIAFSVKRLHNSTS